MSKRGGCTQPPLTSPGRGGWDARIGNMGGRSGTRNGRSTARKTGELAWRATSPTASDCGALSQARPERG